MKKWAREQGKGQEQNGGRSTKLFLSCGRRGRRRKASPGRGIHPRESEEAVVVDDEIRGKELFDQSSRCFPVRKA